jgi:polyphosphate kinase
MASESTHLPTHVPGSIEEGPLDDTLLAVAADTFDVEPPYQPSAEALAAVEQYADRFLDREVSWLQFNKRVLELAEDTSLPLLERVRFLAIFASNLDEFFMVRVAGLKRRIAAGVAVRSASGQLPREVLESIWANTRELMHQHAELFREELLPALHKEGIEVVRWDDLDREEQKQCKRLFRDRVFPVLTPLAVDPAHPFPYISGLSLNLAVLVRKPKTG